VRAGRSDELLVDKLFANDIARFARGAEECYEKQQFRDALIQAWDMLQHSRDRYRGMTASMGGMHSELLRDFIRTQTLLLAPICPHYAEHVWHLLGYSDSIMRAAWPKLPDVDPVLVRVSVYLDKVVPDLRAAVDRLRGKKEAPAGTIWVGTEYLDWQQATLKVLAARASQGAPFDKDFKRSMTSLPTLAPFKHLAKLILPFAQYCVDDFLVRGAEAFELGMPFEEGHVLTETLPFLQSLLSLPSLQVQAWPPTDPASVPKKAQAPLPGRPTVTLG